jgi:hypothetical protein
MAVSLHQPMKNISFKVVIGNALPCLLEALHHGNPIPAGYARVSVDDIVPRLEDLVIDFPTPEGDVKHGDVKRYIILWQKKYIKFPGSAPRLPTPKNLSPPSPGECHPPTPPPSPPQAPHQLMPPLSPPQARQLMLPLVHLPCVSPRCPQCTSRASGEAAPNTTQ